MSAAALAFASGTLAKSVVRRAYMRIQEASFISAWIQKE
jgi:hypothetical protein